MIEHHAEFEEKIGEIVNLILRDYEKGRDIDQMDVFAQPDKAQVTNLVQKLMIVVFPGYYREKVYRSFNDNNRLTMIMEDVLYNLRKQIFLALRYQEDFAQATEIEMQRHAEEVCTKFFQKIPKIREFINTDIQATFDGDPASLSKAEIVLCYPGLFATSVNRLAHELYLLNVPLIPRMLTDYAHGPTGIDINPGAKIGKYFMIDHGTGVVIGETAEIGCHVKVYQGVTIGALSTREGQELRGRKRHPTIHDNVTIYSGASILGGETVIGRDAVIGGNVFITSSIKPGTRVSVKNQELVYRNDDEACFRCD